MSAALGLCWRATELTDRQRLVLAKAREILRAEFAGETVRLYVPSIDAKQRAEQQRRIARALSAGEPVAAIAKRENVSETTVKNAKRRLRGTLGGTLPP